MIFILGHLIFCMLCEFKCTWRSKFDTSHQVMVLKLLAEICKETKTRKKMLEYILFDKVKYVCICSKIMFLLHVLLKFIKIRS